jgi:translation initiation factor IF-1
MTNNKNNNSGGQQQQDSLHVEQIGVVTNSIKGIIMVQLDSGTQVRAHLSGKIRLHKINIVPGDRVNVKLSPYDLSMGIITKRL